MYAIVAFLAALLAAGLIQLLFRFTPQPAAFFNWIVALITLIAAVVPFVFDAGLADQVATAILNALLGLTILILISATARRSLPAAVRRGSNPNPRPPRPF